MVEEGRYELLPERLLDWFAANARDLPWRRDREPYHVWLSEIMLQQTRVEAVKGYYERFLQALPTIADLADAPYEQVQKLWEGLGYYSRARNLQRAAIRIQQEFGGVFPTDYAAIRSLPGVGDYTAGAIASICFDAPTPAVDGNVLRVLSRIDCLEKNVDEPKVRQELRSALSLVYPKGRCGAFTQSLMELGATVCMPNGAPDCGSCPMCRDSWMSREPWRRPGSWAASLRSFCAWCIVSTSLPISHGKCAAMSFGSARAGRSPGQTRRTLKASMPCQPPFGSFSTEGKKRNDPERTNGSRPDL